MKRVVITGTGIVSCIGIGKQAVAESLYHGRSGIGIDPEREEMGFYSPLTGLIPDFDPPQYLGRKQRKTLPEFGVQAYAAVSEALQESGLKPEDVKNDHTGLIFGVDSSCRASVRQADLLRERGRTGSIGSGAIFRSMNSTVTMNLNVILGTKGACWTLSSACSSGGNAVGQAYDLISLGRQKRVICGGAQEINWESMCSFDGLGAFSRHTREPEKASRPFDAGRDGLVPSGGAAALVLEDREEALKRGAAIIGEVRGYGFSSDGYLLSVPSPTGLARAMRAALENAAWTAEEIDYICAHATATSSGDAAEAQNIKEIFSGCSPRISSLKSMTGHELWMAGASHVVYSCLMAGGGFIAPNINLSTLDAAARDLNIVRETVPEKPRKVMCNSSGFGGTNCALVLEF